MRKVFQCGAYLRLSKEDFKKLETDLSLSIENQRMIIESFCNYQGFKVTKYYIDDGYSGSNFDRPAFKEMLEDIESKKINCVITKDFSRLGRELYQTGIFIEEFFNEKNIRYISVNDGYDSFSNNNDSSISMKLTFNDYILRDTSKKIRSVFSVKKKNGQYIGSFPKYGFIKDPLDHNHLIPDPVASLIVKRMFNLALKGNTCGEIANLFTSEKIPIPVVYKKESRGLKITANDGYGIWRAQTIRDILKSEMYIGNMVQNTYEKVRYNSKKLRAIDPEDYIIVEGTHEAIVDKDVFEKVQSMLVSNNNLKPIKKEYLFNGLLFCKECGSKISIREKQNKGNNARFTQCNGYAKVGNSGVCNNHRLNYYLLESDLLNLIKEIGNEFLKEYDSKSLTEEVNEILNNETISIQKDIDSVSKEILKYNSAIEKLYIDNVQKTIPDNIYRNLLEKYTKDLSIATQQKEKLEEEKIKVLSKVEGLNYDRCAEILKDYLALKNPDRMFILNLVKRVEIDNDKNVKIFFNFPELTCFVH